MESLPLLPGYTFPSTDPLLKDYKLKQKFNFRNGFPVIRDNFVDNECLCADAVSYDPALTYGRQRLHKRYEPKRFVPHYVLFDRKILKFEGYYKLGIFGSPDEHCRVCRVRLVYFLEDDTFMVTEPRVINAGYHQGKLVKRGKIPIPDKPGRVYHWKDLNVGINLPISGIVYRLANCDLFTREFLSSQGIDVNDDEDLPEDPYMRERALKEMLAHPPGQNTGRHSLAQASLYRFLEYDGMVLTFNARYNEELYKVRYFLADDTMTLSCVRTPNDGKSMNGSLILKRTKVPKNWKDVPADYPTACMEVTDTEVREYYTPKDLKVGGTAFIFGRRFFLYDCDPFTRKYYSRVLEIEQPTAIAMPECESDAPPQCPPVKDRTARDIIRQIYHFPKRLRYALAMESAHPENVGREFILEYNLCDGAMRILEVAKRNSGRREGCFLNWNRVAKPDMEEAYTPEDFLVGARLNFYQHWFRVTGTDRFVYNYMLANPSKFTEAARANVREYLLCKGLLEEECRQVDQTNEPETEAAS